MQLHVKLFGPQSQLVGNDTVALQLPDPATCADVRHALYEAAPALRESLPHSRLAVNQAFAGDDHAVQAGDEVALIGMVSGG